MLTVVNMFSVLKRKWVSRSLGFSRTRAGLKEMNQMVHQLQIHPIPNGTCIYFKLRVCSIASFKLSSLLDPKTAASEWTRYVDFLTRKECKVQGRCKTEGKISSYRDWWNTICQCLNNILYSEHHAAASATWQACSPSKGKPSEVKQAIPPNDSLYPVSPCQTTTTFSSTVHTTFAKS